jgi:hypothetical protein
VTIALVFALGRTMRQIRAMRQREQLAINADLAIVEVKQRRRQSLKFKETS